MKNAESVTIQVQCRPEVAEKVAAILEREGDPQIATTAEELAELERSLLKQVHELCGLVMEKQIQYPRTGSDHAIPLINM